MATRSYWLSRPPQRVAAASGHGAVDVVIVGGGVTGCACALAIAERGLRVRLFEAGEIASGASGRNGGFALRGLAPAYDDVRLRLGRHPARLLWELSGRALARIEQLAGDAFARVGSLRLALDAAELDALGRELATLREDGFAARWAAPLAPPLERLYVGGLCHPDDGALDPARWVRRLAGHAVAAGAELVEHRRVEAGELDAFACEAVVVAVDASTAALVPELAPFAEPTRGQMLATAPGRERLYPLPHYARGGYDYWQQLPDGRLLVGGRRDTALAAERSSDDETTPFIQEQLERLAAQLLGRPPLVTHRWAGCWGETPDRLPLAGRVPGRERVWVAGGYSGHGNVLGLACGELVAAAIVGEEPAELAFFAPRRFLASAQPRAGSAPTQAGHQ